MQSKCVGEILFPAPHSEKNINLTQNYSDLKLKSDLD